MINGIYNISNVFRTYSSDLMCELPWVKWKNRRVKYQLSTSGSPWRSQVSSVDFHLNDIKAQRTCVWSAKLLAWWTAAPTHRWRSHSKLGRTWWSNIHRCCLDCYKERNVSSYHLNRATVSLMFQLGDTRPNMKKNLKQWWKNLSRRKLTLWKRWRKNTVTI